MCRFRAMVSTDWSVTGQGVFSYCSWFWPLPTWSCCFSGPGAETLRCHFQGGKAGREVTLGARSLFSQFCPLPGIWAFFPGDHLHLAVNSSALLNSSAIVFSGLCFPIPLAKEFSQLRAILSQLNPEPSQVLPGTVLTILSHYH